MAIVKHIKSRNANYSAAINYLLFEHDVVVKHFCNTYG